MELPIQLSVTGVTYNKDVHTSADQFRGLQAPVDVMYIIVLRIGDVLDLVVENVDLGIPALPAICSDIF